MKSADFQIIDVDPNKVDLPKYQRSYDRAWAERMAEEFDADLFEFPSISPNGDPGRYYCDRGQHRIRMAQILGWKTVPCYLREKRDYKERASLFVKDALARKAMSPYARWNALVEAKDPRIIAIKRIVEREGFRVSEGPGSNHLMAIAALESIFNSHGGEVLARVLAVVRNAGWVGQKGSTTSIMLRGLAALLRLAEDQEKSRTKIEKKLSTELPSVLVNNAKVLAATTNHTGAEAMVAALVTHLRSGRGRVAITLAG